MGQADVLEAMAHSSGAHVFAFVLGALFGSFANVCIYRLPPSEEHPEGRSVVSPASHCFACGAAVRWYDNVPLVSFLWLRGRCRDCGVGFSSRYLWVELLTALLFLGVYVFVVSSGAVDGDLPARMGRFAMYSALVFTLVVITFIDLDHKLILNKVTYPAIPLFYGLGLLLPERAPTDGLIGMVVGYGLIRAISDGYYYLTGREGMGYGDGKLLAIFGAFFGWKVVLFALFSGSVVGSVISTLVLVLAKRSHRHAEVAATGDSEEGGNGGVGDSEEPALALRHVEVPFGPFLVIGGLLYLFLEPRLAATVFAIYGI